MTRNALLLILIPFVATLLAWPTPGRGATIPDAIPDAIPDKGLVVCRDSVYLHCVIT